VTTDGAPGVTAKKLIGRIRLEMEKNNPEFYT
jgi:hypothetical protein